METKNQTMEKKGYTKVTKIINSKEREVWQPNSKLAAKIERKASFNNFLEEKVEEMRAIYLSSSPAEQAAMSNRDYIFVAFSAKENAKALSAQWDSKMKSWFIPANAANHERQLLHRSFQSLALI